MDTQSLIDVWNLTQERPGTSAARAAAGVLLGLYNGDRFPFDLTDLRLLDERNLKSAMQVIAADASACHMEVHEWLNRLTGRRDFGHRFEQLAHQYAKFKRGRCKREYLTPVDPPVLSIHGLDFVAEAKKLSDQVIEKASRGA